ncbi:hypothetical protein KIN20_011029 [Parelaphostrongylus tenuis]|uniref:ABC1 atypical kinase-like domain-containing protein n=1 Tax=Parelaphostrongylus tenuis TaxID=148309 RepID=A0AAD5MUV1_PARTN|nr:hypothetical protein KIN20_011029 [Parelaphostrongylus tenuis]
MLSLQDPDTVPAYLLEIFERVRQSADFMPRRQVHKQMTASFGPSWRTRFSSFEDRPFAAASIGQVHRAVLLDGKKVAVKIQYPGVAEGIDSDIDNLEKFVEVARKELALECDYMREARAMRKFRELLADFKDFYVPGFDFHVVESLTTNRVLTAEYVVGKPVDKCINEPQVVRDYIAGKFIELCLMRYSFGGLCKRIRIGRTSFWESIQNRVSLKFSFGGDFLPFIARSTSDCLGEPRMVLLDFGASRSYGKKFVDGYIKLIKAASERDARKILE